MSQLLSHLQQSLPAGLQLLEQMVNMDSPSTEKTLVDRFAGFAGAHFQEIGGAVDYVPVERFGDHLRIRFAGNAPEKILLLGHTDTVFGAGTAAQRPFRIENGRATGPGVFDMKSGILLMWMALRALLRAEGTLRRPVTVLLTSDEEMGSRTSRALVETEASASRAVLVVEPSLPGGVLKTGRKGTGNFTVKAVGKAAHAGVDPAKGINAIEEIARQILSIHRLSDIQRGTMLTTTLIHGGTRSNVVPAEAAIEVDVRVSTMDEASRTVKALQSLQPQVAGARLEVRGGMNRPPMERTAGTVELFRLARAVGAELGLDIQEGATGGASDGNFTSALGIPTLDGLGPIGDNAHGVDEYVDVASIPKRAALLAGLLSRL